MNGPAQTGTLEERLGDLVDSTRWLAGHLWRSEIRHASILAAVRPPEVIMAGAVALVSSGAGPITWSRNFREDVAAATIEDPNAVGPLLVVTGDGPDLAYQAGGPGRLLVPRGGRGRIPMLGSTLSITAITPPAYAQALSGPRYASVESAATATLVTAPAAGQIRVRSCWFSAPGAGQGTLLQSSDGTVIVSAVSSNGNGTTSSDFGLDGPILPAGTSLELAQAVAAYLAAGVVYDVVSTGGPLIAYVTLEGRR